MGNCNTTLVTTNHTVARDLRASVGVRVDGVPAGLTWGQFKAAMTLLGVADDDRVASIEYGCAQCGTGKLVRDDAPDGIEIRERVS